MSTHRSLMHQGVEGCLSFLQLKFWILCCGQLLQRIKWRCVTFRRMMVALETFFVLSQPIVKRFFYFIALGNASNLKKWNWKSSGWLLRKMKKSAKNTAHATEFKSWRLRDIWKIRAEMVSWKVLIYKSLLAIFYIFLLPCTIPFWKQVTFFCGKNCLWIDISLEWEGN